MEDTAVLDNIQGLIHFFNIVLKSSRSAERVANPVTSPEIETQSATPPNPIIPVVSVSEEYRHIVRERCACGGSFVSRRQSTALSAMGQFDDISADCVECGSNHLFQFFLGSASGRPKLHLA